MATLPKDREYRTIELATLKDLRHTVQQTQAQMATTLEVRSDTIFLFE